MTNVGVTLIAEGQTEFEAALNKATQAIGLLNESVGKLGSTVSSEMAAEEAKTRVLTQEIIGFGGLDEALKITNDLLALQIAILLDNARAAGGYSTGIDRATQSNVSFIAESRAARIALAAVTAEMALASVAAGVTLPQGLREAADSLKIVGDLAISGLFIGGGTGALVGGIAGLLIALGTAATSIDPAITRLNQSLDSLSKKDEVVDTLMKVAGVTRDVADEWQKAAEKSPEFAKRLDDIVKAAEPVPAALTTINTLMKDLSTNTGATGKVLGDLGNFLNQFVQQIVAFESAGVKALEDLTANLIVFSRAGLDLVKGNLEAFNNDLKDAKTFGDISADTMKVYKDVLAAGDTELKKTAIDQKTVNDLNAAAAAILEDDTKAAEKATTAWDTYAKALQDVATRTDQLNERTSQQKDQAQVTEHDTFDDAERTFREAQAQAEEQHTDRLSDIWVQRKERLDDIQTKFGEDILKIDQSRIDRESDAEQQLTDRLSDIQQTLSDRIEGIQHDLQTKLAELAHTREQSIQSDNDKEAKAAQDLAEKLYQIEKKRIEDTEALDFNTAEQLRNAKTDHDREAILRQHQFQQGQIDQNANDAKQTAEQTYADTVKQAEKEKQLAKETYDYQVMLARQKADYDVQQAQRTAAEQRATAERTAQEQIAVAERTAKEQRALALQTANDQRLTAQRTYEDERALADRARSEAVAKDRQAEQDKYNDAQRAYNERIKAIDATYAEELKQIQAVKEAADEAFRAAVINFSILFNISQAFATQLLQLSALEHQMAQGAAGGFGNPVGEGNFGGVPGGANGADFTVPSGYPNDSFPVMATSGERVVITPAGNTSNSSSMTVNIPIYGQTDPAKVQQLVRQIFSNVAAGYPA